MTIEVDVERVEGQWILTCDRVDSGVVATVTRLADAEAAARERLAIMLDVAASSLDVQILVRDIGPVTNLNDRSRALLEWRAQEKELHKRIVEETDALARGLGSQDVPARDIATLIGVNHQRVSQLVNRK